MPASSDGIVTVTQDVTYASVKIVLAWTATVPWRTTVTRTNPDGTVVTVRSGDLAFTPGGSGFVYDHEAPLEGTLRYQAYGYDPNGNLVHTSTVAALVLPTAVRSAWLKSTVNPSLSQFVTIVGPFGESWKQPEKEFVIPGRRNSIIWGDVQHGMTGQLAILTSSKAEFDNIRACAGSGVCLFQASVNDYAFPYDVFAVFSLVTPTRPGDAAGWGTRVITLPFTEQDRPATTGSVLQIPQWTNDIVASTYPTYTAFDAAFSTYTAQAKGP